MSEQPEDYITDALEMMGAGYSREVVHIERPSQTVLENETGYEVVKSLGWVKFSADFRKKMLRVLKGAKLSVFICVCLHINENGVSFPGIDKIAEETGYDRDTIMQAVREMEEINGLLNVVRERGKSNKYRPFFVARGVKNNPSEPVQKIRPVGRPVQKSKTAFSETSPENLDSKKNLRIKENVDFSKPIPDNYPLEWYLAYDLAIPAEWKDPSGDAQRNEFERALGFGSLPWGTGDFERFSKWVIKTHDADPTTFQKYAEWRKGDGKYNGMNNKQIRMNPMMFVDTGYPTYLASVSMQEAREVKKAKVYDPSQEPVKQNIPAPENLRRRNG